MPPSVKFDNVVDDSEIEDGAILFRVTTPMFAEPVLLLNGGGTKTSEGRWHRPSQPTSYVADNVLLCLAESLFYMDRKAIKKLENRTFGEFRKEAAKDFTLSIIECGRMPNLVHVASSDAMLNYQLTPRR